MRLRSHNMKKNRIKTIIPILSQVYLNDYETPIIHVFALGLHINLIIHDLVPYLVVPRWSAPTQSSLFVCFITQIKETKVLIWKSLLII